MSARWRSSSPTDEESLSLPDVKILAVELVVEHHDAEGALRRLERERRRVLTTGAHLVAVVHRVVRLVVHRGPVGRLEPGAVRELEGEHGRRHLDRAR